MGTLRVGFACAVDPPAVPTQQHAFGLESDLSATVSMPGMYQTDATKVTKAVKGLNHIDTSPKLPRNSLCASDCKDP